MQLPTGQICHFPATVRGRVAACVAIVRRARQLLGTDIAYLGLNDQADDAAYIRVTDGSVSDAFANLRLPFGTGLALRIWRLREAR